MSSEKGSLPSSFFVERPVSLAPWPVAFSGGDSPAVFLQRRHLCISPRIDRTLADELFNGCARNPANLVGDPNLRQYASSEELVDEAYRNRRAFPANQASRFNFID
jgi:hypothetical protein